MSMPEPMVNSSGRRKKEFTFILVSRRRTHAFTFLNCLTVCHATNSWGGGLPLCAWVAISSVSVIKPLTYLNSRMLSQTEVTTSICIVFGFMYLTPPEGLQTDKPLVSLAKGGVWERVSAALRNKE